MTGHITRIATVVGALAITISLGCGNDSQNPFLSTGSFDSIDTAAEAAATIKANTIDAELLVLADDIEDIDIPAPPPDHRPPPRIDRLQEALGLTDDQVAQIEQIVESSRDARTTIHEQVRDGTLTREEAREQFEAIREDDKTRIEAVLTEEQRTQFEELRAEHGRQFNRRSLRDILNLTDEQAEQFETIMQGIRDQIHDIRAQVESGELTREEARDQLQTLRESERDQLTAILDDDQLALFGRVLNHTRFGFGPRGFGRGPHGQFQRPGPVA